VVAEGWQPQKQQQQPPSQRGSSSLSLINDTNRDKEEDDTSTNPPRVQHPEDFIDEQDQDKWGGPAVAVQQRDCRDSRMDTISTTQRPEKPQCWHTNVLWSVDKAPDNVGRHLLLRLLG
jgi:hypothetical protein